MEKVGYTKIYTLSADTNFADFLSDFRANLNWAHEILDDSDPEYNLTKWNNKVIENVHIVPEQEGRCVRVSWQTNWMDRNESYKVMNNVAVASGAIVRNPQHGLY